LRQVTQEEVHAALAKDNPGYNGKAQFGEENGFIVAVSLDECPNVKNINGLSFLPLKALYLKGTQVSDLSVVKHMKGLVELYIEETKVASLKPLKGLKIQKLYLSNTLVTSLDGLEGMPLIEMNAVGTKISDISGLKGAPLQMLWLNDAPVVDASALGESKSLQSLTLKGTNVKDLSFVKGMTGLQRLHIGETKVTDLTPLKGKGLTRLVFTPSRIKKGIMDARRIGTMQQIGVEFSDNPESLLPPIEFWEKYDKGEYK
jgi:Leucine-rich repeat (LRR) protein